MTKCIIRHHNERKSMLVEIEVEDLEQAAKLIGKTNKMWNQYQGMLTMCEKFKQEGLEPIVLINQLTGGFVVSSRELQQGKFN